LLVEVDTEGSMLDIQAVNHVGIRIRDRKRSVAFYETLGFETVADAGFEHGHPIILRHPCGVVLNLLGPATAPGNDNILMDSNEKHPGITHVALTVASLPVAKEFVSGEGIEITGSFSFGGMSAIFIRDPDRNVIEIDAYGESVAGGDAGGDMGGYTNHPG
jgi:catechol 2,3-dioxygenase-like lactoylglutathione lyase family enzyme